MINQAATKAYKAKKKLIEKRIKAIQNEIINHIKPGTKTHYGHLADLGYVEELLHRAEAFMKNEDIED